MVKVFVANRGEVALRLVRAARDLGLETIVPILSDSDIVRGSEGVQLQGKGAPAFLDIPQLVSAAIDSGAGIVLPGYGLLSESAEFAEALRVKGIEFAGPSSAALRLFGDKVKSREFAVKCGVPVVPGRKVGSPDEVKKFFVENGEMPVMIKAANGGGGKGMRKVTRVNEVAQAFERCANEAKTFFGTGELLVESFVEDAKHVEVQIVADSHGSVRAFGTRDCSVQRGNQKLVEIAPCPSLSKNAEAKLENFALLMARKIEFSGLGTFEFLVNERLGTFYFIECNPRLQVEHTVTEEVFDIDLVQAQIRIAQGWHIEDTFRSQYYVQGFAIQLRVNTETMNETGNAKPQFGIVKTLDFPAGKGVRVETAARVGYKPSQHFDSLFAKIIVTGSNFTMALGRAQNALKELRLTGLKTNQSFLLACLEHREFQDNALLSTSFVTNNIKQLLKASDFHEASLSTSINITNIAKTFRKPVAGEGSIVAPLSAEIVEVAVQPEDVVEIGDKIAVLQAFKMEHLVQAPFRGKVSRMFYQKGELIEEGTVLLDLERSDEVSGPGKGAQSSIDLDSYRRDDLDALFKREAILDDDFRRDAIEQKRHSKGRRGAMENVNSLVDEGSFVELGRLAIAHQEGRRKLGDLVEQTQRDGIIAGIGMIDGEQCAITTYDYLVLAGTQGHRGHMKKDRLYELALKWKLPLVVLTEGGGGRPSDFGAVGKSTAGLNISTFRLLAECQDRVRIGLASGYNFAGNAMLLGMCDCIIATKDANIAMAGPAMVEFAGQGEKVNPGELGPAMQHFKNGVVHFMADNEEHAVEISKKCLAFFTKRTMENPMTSVDQRILRTLVPENRKRAYDVRPIVHALADTNSLLEWSSAFGAGLVTAFARVGGRSLAMIANQPLHLGGALDGEACAKGATFLRMCDRLGLPVLSLIDTPGFIVGQEFEKTGLVKHCSDFFLASSQLSVGIMSIVLRKCYGLGAMAMSAGAIQNKSVFSVGFPSSEFGGMGLEGAVALTFRKELNAIKDEKERQELFEKLVQKMYDRGGAEATANDFAIDDIIDPKDTRKWILKFLEVVEPHLRSKI